MQYSESKNFEKQSFLKLSVINKTREENDKQLISEEVKVLYTKNSSISRKTYFQNS